MGTYVVGDIHGCYDEWMELKSRIEKEDRAAVFILTGDIIDRGPKTIEMVNWAIENITEDGKYQMVLGNHESEKIYWWDYWFLPKYREYELNGIKVGLDAINTDNYGFSDEYIKRNLGIAEFRKAINFFRKLSLYKDLVINNQRYIIAHANIPYSIIKNDGTLIKELTNRQKEFIVWDRDISNFEKIEKVILINGHNPSVFPDCVVPGGELEKIQYLSNRICVDCGLVYKPYLKLGNLAAIRLEDKKEFYLFNE